ncbi:MAG: DUF3108 domain-containing protein [Candidatus Kaelpia imicola]|nr:DUF3108 domain-containing protein [Candidatus Kaelpia imicola]
MKLKFKILIPLAVLVIAAVSYSRFLLFDRNNLNLPQNINNLHYQAYWWIIPVGEAVLTVSENQLYNGEDAVLIEAEAETKGIFETIFGIKTKMNSVVDAETMLPILFREVTYRVDEKKEDKIINYDQENNKLTTKDAICRILPSTHDPLSAIMFLRNKDIKEGDNIEINLNSNRSNYKVGIDVMNKIKNREREFFHLKGLSERRQGEKARHRVEFSLYITEGEHIPVLIRAFTPLGPIAFKLVNPD